MKRLQRCSTNRLEGALIDVAPQANAFAIPQADVGDDDAFARWTREELFRLGDLTLAELLRHFARYGGTILEQDGLLLFAGAHPHPNPYRNGAIRLHPGLDGKEVLARAAKYFDGRKRSYVVWASRHNDEDVIAAASNTGLTLLEEGGLPELVLPELPGDLPPPAGIELRPVADEKTRRDYVAIVAEAWGMAGVPHELASAIFFDPICVDAPNVSAFLAYVDDVPLSGAMTLVSHGMALGCQAATVRRLSKDVRLPAPEPGARRRGLADSCLYAALKTSFERLGARGALGQSSASGAAIWTRFGYRQFTSYYRFLVRPNGPSAR